MEEPCSWSLVKKIGKGSFGDVYKGFVAIKIVNLEADEEGIEEMRREISILSHCSSEYITTYHGSTIQGTNLWIVMDYCGLGSLRNILNYGGPVPERILVYIAKEMALGLCYLHRNRIIHRDIKSANILLTEQGQVKYCDFGVSGLLVSNARRTTFVGTPYWMAPEVIKRSEYDFKADIWSYGITLVELALGNPPHAHLDPSKAIVMITKSPPPTLPSTFSEPFREFVALCLSTDPSKRPGVEDLLKHKFLKFVKKNKEFMDWIVQWNANIKEMRGEDSSLPGPESKQESELSSHATVIENAKGEGAPFSIHVNASECSPSWAFDDDVASPFTSASENLHVSFNTANFDSPRLLDLQEYDTMYKNKAPSPASLDTSLLSSPIPRAAPCRTPDNSVDDSIFFEKMHSLNFIGDEETNDFDGSFEFKDAKQEFSQASSNQSSHSQSQYEDPYDDIIKLGPEHDDLFCLPLVMWSANKNSPVPALQPTSVSRASPDLSPVPPRSTLPMEQEGRDALASDYNLEIQSPSYKKRQRLYRTLRKSKKTISHHHEPKTMAAILQLKTFELANYIHYSSQRPAADPLPSAQAPDAKDVEEDEPGSKNERLQHDKAWREFDQSVDDMMRQYAKMESLLSVAIDHLRQHEA